MSPAGCGRSLAVPVVALLLGGCLFPGRLHLGDVWLQAGQGLAMAGNHVVLAIN